MGSNADKITQEENANKKYKQSSRPDSNHPCEVH